MNQLNYCDNIDFDNTYESKVRSHIIHEDIDKMIYDRISYNNGTHNPNYDRMKTKSGMYDDFFKFSVNYEKSKYNPDSKLESAYRKHRADFYDMKKNLLHTDNIGLNRFYNLHINPQLNVIETFNGHQSRIGLDTTQIIKDKCI